MLSILLLILKIIGIVLLSILGIVLLLILLILFAPIRYQVKGTFQDKKPYVEGKVVWFIPGFSCRLKFDEKLTYSVKWFFHIFLSEKDTENSPDEKEHKKGKKEKKQSKKADHKEQKKNRNNDQKNEQKNDQENDQENNLKNDQKNNQKNEQVLSESVERPQGRDSILSPFENEKDAKVLTESEETALKKETLSKEETVSKEDATFKKETIPIEEAISAEDYISEENTEEKEDLGEFEDSSPKRKKGFFSKMKQSCFSVFLKMKGLLEKVKGILSKIRYTFLNICDKIGDVKNRITYYYDLWQKDATQKVWQDCKDRVAKLFKHLKPKKFDINLSIGMEDPSTTGMIMGIWGMLYPIIGGTIHINPSFEEEILEGRLLLKGKIRVIHILITALKFYRDKRLKKLISLLKKGGK